MSAEMNKTTVAIRAVTLFPPSYFQGGSLT
jgi:hypothetical protein